MKLRTQSEFNSDMLLLARQVRQVTQAELADLCDTTQGSISKAENGLMEPSRDLVVALARALRVRSSFFFHTDRVYGLPLHLPRYHRKKKRMSKRLLEKIHAEITIQRFQIARLLPAARIEAKYELPQLDIDEYHGDAAMVAQVLRSAWSLPRGPIEDLVTLVEQAGCIIVPCGFGTADLDGISESFESEPIPPLIFVNDRVPTDRLRWTIAHELGHLVMHAIPAPEMEDQANTFAAEFLMPEHDIKPHLRGASLRKLAQLKPVWRVSMAALLVRARTLGVLKESRYRYLWTEMSRHGYRRQEPPELDLSPENPTVLAELFRLHLTDLGYSREDLSELFGLYPEDVDDRYFADTALRLVG